MNGFKSLKSFIIKHNLFDFRTRNYKFSMVAIIFNILAGIFKIFAAFYIGSYFLIVSSLYSFGIGLTTQLFFRGIKRTNSIPAKEKKYTILMYLSLFVSSIVYTFYTARQFYIELPYFAYGMILSLAIAVVSIVELIVAVYGLVKAYHLRDSLLTARKIITLINGLVAIVVTETAIMTYVVKNPDSFPISHVILGVIVGGIAMVISSVMLIKHLLSNRKPLSIMSKEELDILFPIVLVPHKKRWHKRFNREKRYLFNHLPKHSVKQIEHIGSTALDNILAMNIIDMLVIIDDQANINEIAKKMKRLGFKIVQEDNHFVSLNKGYTKFGYARDVFHVTLRDSDDCDEIYFRDYLNENPKEAKAYEILKIELAKRYMNERDTYRRAKTNFIMEKTKKAKKKQSNLTKPL